MAEFSLGLTKTAVEGTLSLVKSAVEDEKKLREAVQNDLVFITGEFEVMQSFLQDANKENSKNDKVTLALVRQLRTLAFDVEDCVEYVIHLDLDKSSISGALRRLWQTVNCSAPPLPLDIAVAEIRQLKARVEDVSKRNRRYNHIFHGSDDNDHNNNKQPVTVMPLPAGNATTTVFDPSSAAFHALRDAWKETRKWSCNSCSLQEELISHKGEDDRDLQVISVWGSSICTGGGGADLGTAFIFKKAYYDPKICENFRSRAWVKLTHPFNHDEFVKSLVTQFCASSHESNVEFTEGNLMRAKKVMMQQMIWQRYLVVLEDVLTEAEWDVISMYLPDSKNGSRILLSTPQLGIALHCTGEPYQVSELTNFSDDNQFLCTFSKQHKARRDIGEFCHQLLQGHGVFSVWGADGKGKIKSRLVDILYKGMINGRLEEIEGLANKSSDHVHMLRKRSDRMEQCSWVDVPYPFNVNVFARRLFLSIHSDDIMAEDITSVCEKGQEGLIKWCRRFLSEGNVYFPYFVVINGLQSVDDWDSIEHTFCSSKATTAKAGCILVVTEEVTVARHCVKGHTHLVLEAEYLMADPSISALIKKGSWHYAITGRKCRLFYDRKEDGNEWSSKFSYSFFGEDRIIRHERISQKKPHKRNPHKRKDDDVEGFHVFTVKLDGNYGKCVLRNAYYGGAGLFQPLERRKSWVDMRSNYFDLDFAWRLLLDFYSDDPIQKEEVAVGLMEGTINDPIEKCREFLHNNKCLVVINGLGSKEDWDTVKDTFFSDEQHIQSIIVVGSTMASEEEDEFIRATKAQRLGTKEQDRGRLIDLEYSRIFSTKKKYQDAIKWVKGSRLPPYRERVDEGFQPVGRDKELSSLHSFVSRYTPRHEFVVSVFGLIPGVGKSTLAKDVYYKEIVHSSGLESSDGQRPYEAFAWVDVPNPFNLTEFAWRLLQDFYSEDPQAKETVTATMMEEGHHQVLILECRNILRTRKCLVVMDGLCAKQDWDLIKTTFLAERIRSFIVVITNEEEVAIHCMENKKERAINITRLEDNVALSLLKKIAWKRYELTSSDVDLAKSIVVKCGGLPKVIAAIGEACRQSCRNLEFVRDNFMGILETEPTSHYLRPLFSWMKSYFDACSDSLKPCIFYLPIFPPEEKKNIRRRRLLWRWIAEGYCRDTPDGRTCEENAERFVFELMKLSIIQESGSSKLFCPINGFFHEYIISRPMEDNLVFALKEGCSLNSTRAGQHLTIRSTWDRSDKVVYKNIDFSRLRSLTVYGKWESFFICSKKVNMGLLRVLDLEDAEGVTNDDLEQIAKRLTRLKFLSVRGHTNIKCLPISMGGLRQLQTLDIRGTSIVTLPLFITKLQKLRYICAGTTEVWDWECDVVPVNGTEPTSVQNGIGNVMPYQHMTSSSAQGATNLLPPAAAVVAPTTGAAPTEGNTDTTDTAGSSVSCNNGAHNLVSSLSPKLCRCGGNGSVKVPAGIRKLVVLHALGVINVKGSWCKSICKELKKLTQLRKLGVSGVNKGNIHEFCSAISGHAHLKSLSVELDKDDDLDGLDVIPQPPKILKSLKLYGHVNRLLVWTGQLPNLEKFKLDMTIASPEALGAPNLSRDTAVVGHLRIKPIQDGDLNLGRGWDFARVVEIECRSKLHIKFNDQNISHHVELLKVQFSGRSQSSLEISGLSDLRHLKEVWLKGYTGEHMHGMQRQINHMQLNEGQARPVLKLVQPCVSNGSRSRLSAAMTCCARVLEEEVI